MINNRKSILNRLKLLKKSLENSLHIETILKTHLTIQKYREYALEYPDFNAVCSVKNNPVVSLTTHSKRIHEVYLTIESLLRQTVKPAGIILWLAQDEFDEINIPVILHKQKERGLEIRFCEDIKSYKKLVPLLRETNNTAIITVDDDCIYPADFVDNLIKMHRKYPDCVCYYCGNRITIDTHGKIKPPSEWKQNDSEYIPSVMNFGIGLGGILYPPCCFHDDITNAALFMKYAPTADDLWFKAMTLLKNVRYVKVPIESKIEDKFIFLNNTQDIALHHINLSKHGNNNDKQMNVICEAYHLNLKDIEADKIK
jgi:hypothetical protein